MMSRVFIDTNIFIYAIDRHDPEKQKRCRRRLSDIEKDGNGVISTQVLQEYFVVSTKKIGLDPIVAKQHVETLSNWEVVDIDLEVIRAAIDGSILNQISFWDALIVAAAQSSKCSTLVSEDFGHGRRFKELLVENILI